MKNLLRVALSAGLLVGFGAVGCGGQAFDSDGSAGSAGSGTGGTAGGGAGSSTGGSAAAGSGAAAGTGGGATGGAGGGSGSGGSAGSGGTGGSDCTLTCELRRVGGQPVCDCKRPDVECSNDADCVVGSNVGVCCGGCEDAYPRSIVEAEPCIVGRGEIGDTSMCQPACEEIACPAIACAALKGSQCQAGKCEPKYDCEPDEIDLGERCVPRCDDDGDCVIATFVGDCCGSCPDAYHREQVASDTCLITPGQPAPNECAPPPAVCQNVGCPDIACVDPSSMIPTCNPGGFCEAAFVTF